MEPPRLVLVRPARRKIGRVRRLVIASAFVLVAGELVRRAIQGRGERYSYTPSLAAQLYGYLSVWLDQHIGWPSMPTPVGLIVLLGERVMLRWQNLQDTNTLPSVPQPDLQPKDTSYLTDRSIDGTFNDLRDPRMGSINQ